MVDAKLRAILTELRGELAALLGGRLDGTYLYGSRARGEDRPDSDIDVLVVLRGEFDYAELLRLTSPAVAAVALRHDVVISRVFVSKEQFEAGQSPFLLNVRKEAVAV